MDARFAARAHVFSLKQDMDLRRMDASERAKTFSRNEACLKSFYRSGESETTQNYKFIDVYRPCTVEVSGEIGLGLFLNERAVPGQLLIVDNAKASCSCIPPEDTPYRAGSYIHAPKADWMRRSPRIPEKVHQHLIQLLEAYLSAGTSDPVDLMQILNLDSHKPNGSMDDPPDLWSIVANNALCDMVRGLSKDEPRQVQTFELWGVWLLPSYINHSCSPNCHRMRVGEAMIIRAAKDIAAGDELTLPYFDIFEPRTIRNLNCQTFGFRCDCCRCTFEWLLGTTYNDIQSRMVKLKIQVETEWRKNVTGGSNEIAWKLLLSRLESLMFPIEDTIDDILYESADSIEASWIHASFIDASIGAYAVFMTGYFDELEKSLKTCTKRQRDIIKTEGEQLFFTVIAHILHIINEVHPGNMLGQEFYSILLKTIIRFGETLETPEGHAEYINRGQLQTHEKKAMKFYSSYYGYPGAETLKLLLTVES